MSKLEQELDDVEQVVTDRVHQGGRLERLELYVMSLEDSGEHLVLAVDITQVPTDGAAGALVTRSYMSRLENAMGVVVVSCGSGFKFIGNSAVDDRARD